MTVGSQSSASPGASKSGDVQKFPACIHEISGIRPTFNGPGWVFCVSAIRLPSSVASQWGLLPVFSHSAVTPNAEATDTTVEVSTTVPFSSLLMSCCDTPALLASWVWFMRLSLRCCLIRCAMFMVCKLDLMEKTVKQSEGYFTGCIFTTKRVIYAHEQKHSKSNRNCRFAIRTCSPNRCGLQAAKCVAMATHGLRPC